VKKTTKPLTSKKTTAKKTIGVAKKPAQRQRKVVSKITKSRITSKSKIKTRKRKVAPQKKEYTPPPKKPLGAFFLFIAKQRPKNIEQEDLIQFTKGAGEQWRQLSQAEKQPYLDEAVALKAQWSEEYVAWKKSLSPKGWRQFRKAFRKRARSRVPRDVHTGEPIPRVLSGYNLFLKETYSKIQAENPTIHYKQHFMLTVQAWNSLTNSEKAIWQARYAELLPQNIEAREKAKEKRVTEFKSRHPKIQF